MSQERLVIDTKTILHNHEMFYTMKNTIFYIPVTNLSPYFDIIFDIIESDEFDDATKEAIKDENWDFVMFVRDQDELIDALDGISDPITYNRENNVQIAFTCMDIEKLLASKNQLNGMNVCDVDVLNTANYLKAKIYTSNEDIISAVAKYKLPIQTIKAE